MDINNLKQQAKTSLEQELIDQSNEQANQVIQSLPKFQVKNYSINYEKDIELKNIKEGKKFQYKLLKSQKQQNHGFAFAFNQKGNILFVACKKSIIVYFNCYISKMLLKLTNHTYKVYCLLIMKKSNSFVSGSGDDSIVIWELDQFSKWSVNTQLNGHNHYVLCILMNKSENLLFSGSYDNTVKVWRKIDNKWSCQQKIELDDYSCSLSLNEQEEKLISCGDKPFIYVMQMKQDQTWTIVQIIEVVEKGYRLYFLNDNQLIFQPETKDIIEMYQFDNKLGQFKKHKNVQVQNCKRCDWFFPIQFIKDLKILTVKHGQFLNIFKVEDDGDISLIQTIDFKFLKLYGTLTDDGKYLATWDGASKQIKISKLKFLE